MTVDINSTTYWVSEHTLSDGHEVTLFLGHRRYYSTTRLPSVADLNCSMGLQHSLHDAKNLLRGIPTADLSNVKTEIQSNESKLYIESETQSRSISAIFSVKPDALEEFDCAKDIRCLLRQTKDGEPEISDLPSCIWQVVEYIWPLFAVNNQPNYAVQTKLI